MATSARHPGTHPTKGAPLHISEVNSAPTDELATVLRTCADIPSWVDKLVAGRPYRDKAQLLDRAAALAEAWSDDDVRQALDRHPRIGERAAGSGAEAALSAKEQSAVSTDDITRARLADGNAAYEARFGHIFLIRAAGRGQDEVLAALEERLTNDPQTELKVVAEQLRQIALLRLEAAVTP